MQDAVHAKRKDEPPTKVVLKAHKYVLGIWRLAQRV